MGKSSQLKDINQGDVITFQGVNNKYKVILCTNAYKVKSPHVYSFAALTIDKYEKPTIEDVRASEFFGVGKSAIASFKYSEDELEKMWTFHPGIKPYFLGSYTLFIWRKDFMRFRDNVELIGNLDIVDNLDKHGSAGFNASDWTALRDFFTDAYRDKLEERRQNSTFKVEAIIRA